MGLVAQIGEFPDGNEENRKWNVDVEKHPAMIDRKTILRILNRQSMNSLDARDFRPWQMANSPSCQLVHLRRSTGDFGTEFR